MKFKNYKTAMTILLICLIGNISAMAKKPNDSLWVKAVEIAKKNKFWVPKKIVDKEIVYNESNEIEETTERFYKIFLTDNDLLDIVLSKTLFNGKDITSKEQKLFEVSEKDIYFEPDKNEEPFATYNQENIIVSRIYEPDWIDSTECVVFDYQQITEKARWHGKAWLHKSNGIPLMISFSTDETFEEDGVTIIGLSGTVIFNHQNLTEWYPIKVEYSMQIKTKIFPFYTFKGKVVSKIILSEFFLAYND